MNIYVAGPMRGIPHFNFPAFDAAARHLRLLGHDVFNPAERDRAKHGDDLADQAFDGDEATIEASHGFSLRDALGADLAWITSTADAVAVLPGWHASKGARAEVSTALALGLPVCHYLDVLPHYFATPYNAEHAITSLDIDTTHDAPVDAEVAPSGEVRAVSSTGGEKGVKPAAFHLIPYDALTVIAEHYGKGAAKYSAHNWRRGYEWSKSFAALQRHLAAFWQGEDYDAETGSLHLAAAGFHVLALIAFYRDFPQFDDRYKPDGDE